MRFLVCLVFNENSTPNVHPEVYPLKHAILPEDVTCPPKTICFTFEEGNSINEVVSNCVIFAPNNQKTICPVFGDKKLYLIGKKVTINGETFIQNEEAHVRVPFIPSLDSEMTVIIPE